MNTTSSIALSGMNAARVALDSSAHNIANLNTPGFRRQLVEQRSADGGGVESSVTRATSAGDAPEADTVGLLASKNAFLANLAVFRTQDRMLGSLIDTHG